MRSSRLWPDTVRKIWGFYRKLLIWEKCVVLAMRTCLSLPHVLRTSKYANWLIVSGPVITTLRIICANITGRRMCSLWGKIRISKCNLQECRSHWTRGLRRRSTGARLLGLWVRIPPRAWMFVCCECCVLSGRGLCDGLITRPEESYRLWCVVMCDLETSRMRRPWPALSRSAKGEGGGENVNIQIIRL